MSTFNTIGDFVWASNDTRDWQEEEMEQQERSLELMYMHQQYHGIIEKQQYTLRGSKLSCSYGTEYSLLDTSQDHGIYKGNLPVLTTIDCSKSNICGFGSCLCPESNYAGRLPMTVGSKNGKTAKKASYNKFAHICIPMVPEGSVWKQFDHSIMAKTCAKDYTPMLVDSAVLVCQYGGIIRIIEVPQTGTTQGSGKEYVNLTIMNNIGWSQVHCGYKVKSTGLDSPMTDMTSQITKKHRSLSQDDIDKINSLFEQFEINTEKRICGFFAECSAETDNGFLFLEAADASVTPTRADINYWFNNNKSYGAKYRGAGAIQLTWDYNYKAFKSWMGTELKIIDSDIVDKGAEYVAMTYPWEAAVFFWDTNNLNSIADTMSSTYVSGDINKITAVVNLNMSTAEYAKRDSAYKNWVTNYIMPT